MNSKPTNGYEWTEWGRHVLKEQERQHDCIKELDMKVNEIITAIEVLKVKAGVWGLLGGLIPILVIIGIWLVTKYTSGGGG